MADRCAKCNDFMGNLADVDMVCFLCAQHIVHKQTFKQDFARLKAKVPNYIFDGVCALVKADEMIQGIKLVRGWSATIGPTWSLKESKDFIDYLRDNPV